MIIHLARVKFHPSARTLSDYQQIGSLADPLKQIVPYLPPVCMPGNMQMTDQRIFMAKRPRKENRSPESESCALMLARFCRLSGYLCGTLGRNPECVKT
jgi:hypothetical protein